MLTSGRRSRSASSAAWTNFSPATSPNEPAKKAQSTTYTTARSPWKCPMPNFADSVEPERSSALRSLSVYRSIRSPTRRWRPTRSSTTRRWP